MDRSRTPPTFGAKASNAPPRLHWLALLFLEIFALALITVACRPPYREYLLNIAIAAWPVYFCLWIRKIEPRSTSLYWALASFAAGFLSAWPLWIVVIFEVREDLIFHYQRREKLPFKLNFMLTLLFSFAYFQFKLGRFARSAEPMYAGEPIAISHSVAR